ncbi:hypothetical protein N0B31_05175 [Salinirubellus salinus]|uniref:Uncharacterized protein n=1 Tax=Salinirubellus salinus TaxID=1364945 RepID=A0A9E7R4X6_9EURY|nr:hypothetical protein [Salinirubellus salinus]UWM55677.1 hypothetical protein N0B31_05175 [Salinirubellus salinus]
MTRTTDTETRTRPTDDIDPMVPIMPGRDIRTDGGRITRPERVPRRPPETEYTTEYGRGAEEIAPMVEDLR